MDFLKCRLCSARIKVTASKTLKVAESSAIEDGDIPESMTHQDLLEAAFHRLYIHYAVYHPDYLSHSDDLLK